MRLASAHARAFTRWGNELKYFVDGGRFHAEISVFRGVLDRIRRVVWCGGGVSSWKGDIERGAWRVLVVRGMVVEGWEAFVRGYGVGFGSMERVCGPHEGSLSLRQLGMS